MSYETHLPGSIQIGYKGEKSARDETEQLIQSAATVSETTTYVIGE